MGGKLQEKRKETFDGLCELIKPPGYKDNVLPYLVNKLDYEIINPYRFLSFFYVIF